MGYDVEKQSNEAILRLQYQTRERRMHERFSRIQNSTFFFGFIFSIAIFMRLRNLLLLFQGKCFFGRNCESERKFSLLRYQSSQAPFANIFSSFRSAKFSFPSIISPSIFRSSDETSNEMHPFSCHPHLPSCLRSHYRR